MVIMGAHLTMQSTLTALDLDIFHNRSKHLWKTNTYNKYFHNKYL